VVFRAVQRREVEPVGLDLRAVGDLEADRAPDLLDALPGADHRMHAAAAAAPCRQRNVERLLGEPRGELRFGERGAARLEPGLDLLLRVVELRAQLPPLLRRSRLERRLKRSQLAGLAEIARLGVLEGSRVRCGGEIAERPLDDDFEVLQLQ